MALRDIIREAKDSPDPVARLSFEDPEKLRTALEAIKKSIADPSGMNPENLREKLDDIELLQAAWDRLIAASPASIIPDICVSTQKDDPHTPLRKRHGGEGLTFLH